MPIIKNLYIFAIQLSLTIKKQRSNVQIQSTFICRIAFCKGEASWFGTLIE